MRNGLPAGDHDDRVMKADPISELLQQMLLAPGVCQALPGHWGTQQ